MDQGDVIHRLSVLLCRLEADVLRDMLGLFVQTMAQTAHDAQNFNLAARQETYLESDFAFDMLLLRFRGVLRLRLGDDHRRRKCWLVVLDSDGLGCSLGTEPGAAYSSVTRSAWRAANHSITEAG